MKSLLLLLGIINGDFNDDDAYVYAQSLIFHAIFYAIK